jgi:phosphoglucomutase
MKNLREKPLTELCGLRVTRVEDYLTGIAKEDHDVETIHLPSSDVIKLYLSDGTSVAVRPSGTEPKCKFYYGAVGKTRDEVKDKPNDLHRVLLRFYEIQ